jgi:hypothetical protein
MVERAAFARHSMQEFWIHGGRYVDGKSETLAEGAALESYGPFYSYNDARREWQALALRALAHAGMRYKIVSLRPEPAPA